MHKKTLANERNSVTIEKSGLCICGFTQVQQVRRLLDELRSQDDGLLDRYSTPILNIYIFWSSACNKCVTGMH